MMRCKRTGDGVFGYEEIAYEQHSELPESGSASLPCATLIRPGPIHQLATANARVPHKCIIAHLLFEDRANTLPIHRESTS